MALVPSAMTDLSNSLCVSPAGLCHTCRLHHPPWLQSIILALDQPLLPSFVIAKNLLAAAKLGGTGRRLLQSNRRSHANNWSAQNTQRAIRAAARGDIPVSYATRAGTRNAQLARGGCVNCLRWAQTW